MSDRSRILIVTSYYWPDRTGIGPYATDIAEHFAARGRAVSVLTTLPHYPQWRIDPKYQRRLRHHEHRNGVDITRLWLYVPKRQTAQRRAAYEASFFAHALLRYRPHTGVVVVISVVPNLANAALAGWWTRRNGRHVLLVQDLSGSGASQAGLPGGLAVAGVVSRLEGALAAKARLVLPVTDSFRGSLEERGVRPDRIVTFPNWSRLLSPTSPRAEVRDRLGWRPAEHIVLHAGNMGMKQGLEWIFAYAAEAASKAPSIRFVLMGDGSQRERLEELAQAAPNVDLLPPVPDSRFAEVLAAADILFVHERPGLKNMALPSKLTSYFAAGRPVVAAVEPGGATSVEVARSGAGLASPPGDVGKVVGLLADLARDTSRRDLLAQRGQSYAVESLSREAALARLERLVDDVNER